MIWVDYDCEYFISVLQVFKLCYFYLQVIMEFGSVIVWQMGFLFIWVLDIVENYGVKMVIFDVFFMVYMFDMLEMLYCFVVCGVIDVCEGQFIYCLGGVSCLAGDYMMEYSFEKFL